MDFYITSPQKIINDYIWLYPVYLETFEPKWVNSTLSNIGVNLSHLQYLEYNDSWVIGGLVRQSDITLWTYEMEDSEPK